MILFIIFFFCIYFLVCFLSETFCCVPTAGHQREQFGKEQGKMEGGTVCKASALGSVTFSGLNITLALESDALI